MKFIDMHCDTLMKAFFNDAPECWESDGMCDVKKLKKGGAMAQFLGIFLPQPTSPIWNRFHKEAVPDEVYLETCLKVFNTTMKNHADVIAPARNAHDILANEEKGLISGILTVEDGRNATSSEKLQQYYDRGIRLISLTWNFKNCWGSPNSKDPAVMTEGLTDFGKEGVLHMNELGMIVDVSHLSDGGFWDVAKISTKPFVASHSNARSLSPASRNLTDDMIRAIADHGGVIGLNFMPEFLNEDTISKESTLPLLAKHARYIIDVGGSDVLGIGTDFDGISGNLEIPGSDKMQNLFAYFSTHGFSAEEIEKVAWKNSFRVIREVMK